LLVATTKEARYKDNNLNSDRAYTYFIKAYNISRKYSEQSTVVMVPPFSSGIPASDSNSDHPANMILPTKVIPTPSTSPEAQQRQQVPTIHLYQVRCKAKVSSQLPVLQKKMIIVYSPAAALTGTGKKKKQRMHFPLML
jgi:hypothetical protein